MSLKNVYDVSTAELMIAFYKNLMLGMSKREALVKAQQAIRQKGYKDAKYWATFILLDAIWKKWSHINYIFDRINLFIPFYDQITKNMILSVSYFLLFLSEVNES